MKSDLEKGFSQGAGLHVDIQESRGSKWEERLCNIAIFLSVIGLLVSIAEMIHYL